MARRPKFYRLARIGKVPSLPQPITEREFVQWSRAIQSACKILANEHGTLSIPCGFTSANNREEGKMDSIIYLVGLVVVVLFILSMLGLR